MVRRTKRGTALIQIMALGHDTSAGRLLDILLNEADDGAYPAEPYL